MDIDDVINKCANDLDEIMSSITAIKGEQFVRTLSLHINYCTLCQLSLVVDEHSDVEDLRHMINKTAVLCATESLAYICELNKMTEEDISEIVKWGERLQQMVTDNFKQMKGSE